jgi:nucleoside-diphosphate-sugar epimerase
MEDRTILVTGVAGFIGQRTAKILLSKQCRVIGLDNMTDSENLALQEFRLSQLKKHDHFSFHLIDIQDTKSLEELFAQYQFDAVIHLAAKVGVRESISYPHTYLHTNVQGTLNILEMMQKHKVKKLVFASTSSVYSGLEVPFYENSPVETPISLYATTKRASEMMCYTYHSLYGIDVSILRYFTVYGPAGRPDMSYFRFIRWIDEGKPVTIHGDGTQFRDFSYIEDIANGTVKALKNVGYDIFNLGGGNGTYTLNYMIQLIEEYLGKKAQIVYQDFLSSDMKATWANIDKAKKVLAWQPQVDFKTGIRNCVEWYLDNKAWLSK